jgi:hypothetical protein
MKDNIIEKIQKMNNDELEKVQSMIDYIEYNRYKKRKDENEKVGAILKSRKTNFKEIKEKLQESGIQRHGTGSIPPHIAKKNIRYQLNLDNASDAELIIDHMIKAGVLDKTYNNNITDD